MKKSNSILKNKNKILSYEINTYKNSSIHKNPFSQYDKELNIFIQDLKSSLENATQTNQSLEKIINNSEQENNSLKDKNKQLITQFNLCKEQCEKIIKENSEIKYELENKNEEMKTKDENIKKMQIEIKDLKNIVNNSKNKINYLNNIQESNKLSQKDNEDLIIQLKDTIENLQKINLEKNNEIINLKNKLDTSNALIFSKNDEIANLNEEIGRKDSIIQNKESQINEQKIIIEDNNNKNINNKNEIQKYQMDKEKLNNDIKTLKMVLADRERTISELKKSISFLTKTFNKNMNIINYNISSALMKEENNNLDVNQSLKELVGKMQDEINNLNKKNKESKKEKIMLEKEINEFNEQYEQIKSEYQILYQKFLEQNRNIEIMKNEFIKKDNNKEIQKLTKENFELLAKYKKAQNEIIIKSQQLELFKKNYKLLNGQLIELTTRNYNTNNNSFEYNYNNNELSDVSENKEINNDNMMNNNEYDINKSNEIINNINKDIKLMDSLNMDENNLLQYSSNDNNIYKLSNSNNMINSSVKNESQIKKELEKINNNNLISEENLMNSLNSDKYKLTTEENNKQNIPEDINNKYVLTDKERFTPEKDKFNNLSTQLNMDKLKQLNMFNNIDNLESNEFHSKTFPSSIINNNKYNKEINENISEKNNDNIVSYPNIYTLKENLIINFNLDEKKFILIDPVDNTNGLYQNYLLKNKYIPLTLNTSLGFFILLNDFIFYYDEIKKSINILNKLISSHIEGGFIIINQEIYSISGKDNLSCEKYSIKKGKNIVLPAVNYPRINASLCNINNEYLYVFFGDKCNNLIERLNLSIDYETMQEYMNSWECIKINSLIENGKQIGLEKFTSYLDDNNNVIILGGNNDKGEPNQDIFGLNLSNNEINAIGKIDTCAQYLGQSIQLNDSIFAIYDTNNGLHFFNKELDYHEIYNFNL